MHRSKCSSSATRRSRRRETRLGLALALLAGTLGLALGAGESGHPPHAEVTGFTAPYQSVMLAAVRTGRVQSQCVAEGAATRAGDVVVRLDGAVQQRRVELAEAAAATTIDIDLAQVRLDQAQLELARLRSAERQSAATANELSTAEGAVRAAKLELAKATFQHEQALRELALERAILDEYTITAPFNGLITEHAKQVGDTVEDREGLVQIVQLDPLVVTVDCPIELAAAVKCGGEALVDGGDRFSSTRTARVIFVNPVADAASQTFKVKLHVPNQDGVWLAGMRVSVSFQGALSAPLADATPPSSGRR